MKRKGTSRCTSHQVTVCVILLIFILVGATATVWYSFYSVAKDVDVVCKKACGKRAHIAFIAADLSDDFMKSVLESVRKEADERKIYVECMGEELTETYSKQELLGLAVAAKVDGIILEGDNQEETRKLIADAKEKNIPVVTIRSDCTDSDRACFVGVNNYTLGHSYGNQILNLSYHRSKKDVVILMDQRAEDLGQTIIYSSLCQTLEENPGVKFHIVPIQIDKKLTFEAEEQIRNLFMEEQLPEIVVCLNQLYTNCAVQAIIDLNKVGMTELLGFYDNPLIRQAIQEEVLNCSISIDTEQMGRCCVESLQDIWDTGNTSEYYSVDTFLMNKDTYKDLES